VPRSPASDQTGTDYPDVVAEPIAQPSTTLWVFGDQLNCDAGLLATADPRTCRILMIESTAKITGPHGAGQRWHRQRLHLIITAMRRCAIELRSRGFEVDLRRADSFAAGLAAHRAEFAPAEIHATEPSSFDAVAMCEREGIILSPTTQFTCDYRSFAEWASGRKQLKMEDFYRWQRRRLNYLMEPDGEPTSGQWNHDHENREPPPKENIWRDALTDPLDDIDAQVIADYGLDRDAAHLWGSMPDGTWATSRAGALRRLAHFCTHHAPIFGPHEDAMTTRSWHLAHSLLSPYLNLGLLTPQEVCDAVEQGYRNGQIPIASAEGMIRQIIGWREYIWGVYWLWMPDYRGRNELGAHRALPPVLAGTANTEMRCVSESLSALDSHAYTHHIQRLMVLGNLALLAEVDPWEMTQWMWTRYIDGAEWVMLPNVIGMALHADGGQMATKPYAAGGNYINKMSDYCKGCRYDHRQRTGDDACPFTTLYWEFMARHEQRFARNPRMAQQIRAAQRLNDLAEVRERAQEVLTLLDQGAL
jgi:deoxyribodipyrimidine photolyase-related protein